MPTQHPVRIVILGGGFAGISAATELGRKTKGDPSIEVHLVNNENYFVFQPLLPEVVSCGIEPSHVLNPIRQLCRHVHFHCATVTDVDRAQQCVTIVGSDERRVRTLQYDHLIWCLGLRMDVSRVPGMAEHSLPIKTLGDAFHLRNHVLRRLEEAELETDEALRRKALTVVAVGGGYSGVETVAEINHMIQSVLPYYPTARKTGHRAVLVHSGNRILHELDPGLAEIALAKLQERGVEVRLETQVSEATAAGVVLSNGETIAAGTVICTVGNVPHLLLSKMGLPEDRGRILVDECLRVRGEENIWAIGDAAMVPDVRRGGFCPPTAQYAMRQGRQCARNVLAALQAKSLRPFQFGGFGQLAVVGSHLGVGRVFGVKVSGFLAWVLWRSVYFAKVPGIRCKLLVGFDWALEALFPRDITMIELQRTEQLKHAHFRPGDIIIRQGEIGDRFYIIESGEVEIVQQDPGKQEKRLGTRSTGESFGELALLKDLPRTATVRCLTSVNVVMFNRSDFHALVGSYGIFRAHMDREVAALSQKMQDLATKPEESAP